MVIFSVILTRGICAVFGKNTVLVKFEYTVKNVCKNVKNCHFLSNFVKFSEYFAFLECKMA